MPRLAPPSAPRRRPDVAVSAGPGDVRDLNLTYFFSFFSTDNLSTFRFFFSHAHRVLVRSLFSRRAQSTRACEEGLVFNALRKSQRNRRAPPTGEKRAALFFPFDALPNSPSRRRRRRSSADLKPLSLTGTHPLPPLKKKKKTSAKKKKKLTQGDFGARDPKPGELESNFSDKVLGNWDTAHIIRGPEGLSKLVGLQNRPCSAERAALRLSGSDCVKLRNQVPGWRLQDDPETKEANVLLVRSWNVRDAAAGKELAARAAALADAEGHALAKADAASVSGIETVEVTLQTTALKGLTENDFIVAAKLNEMGTADLEPPKKARFWA